MSNFSSFPLFCYLLLGFHVRQGPDFHFEISEVEITRVNSNYKTKAAYDATKVQRRTATEEPPWNGQ